jgi:hypothetical protein
VIAAPSIRISTGAKGVRPDSSIVSPCTDPLPSLPSGGLDFYSITKGQAKQTLL